MKQVVLTNKAPAAIGAYSQAIKAGNTVYISGQIPLHPETMQLVKGDIKAQTKQAFANLNAIAEAAGGSFEQIVKLTVYLTSMENFAVVNEVLKEFCPEPYPARAVIGVSQLPKGAEVEVDAIMYLPEQG